MSSAQIHDPRRARVFLVAGTIVALALVGLTQVRNQTDLGIRLFGHPKMHWDGGDFPAPPATQGKTYTLEPMRLTHTDVEIGRMLGMTDPKPNPRPSGYSVKDDESFLTLKRSTTPLFIGFTWHASTGSGGSDPERARQVVTKFLADLGLSPDGWEVSARPDAPGEVRVVVSAVVDGEKLIASEPTIGGYLMVEGQRIQSAVLSVSRWQPSAPVDVKPAEAAWRDVIHDPSIKSDLRISGPYTEATYGLAAAPVGPGNGGRQFKLVPVWRFSGKGNTPFFVGAYSSDRLIFNVDVNAL